MKQAIRSSAWNIAVVLVCAALFVTVLGGNMTHRGIPAGGLVSDRTHVLLDAGHGGADGGAAAADGTLEKNINLAITRALGDLLQVLGFVVSYTRTTDCMICTEGESLRERKVSDMRNRLALVEQADFTISIHQNKFSQAKYSGTQVFYGKGNPTSRLVADAIRTSVLELLQPQNKRELKPGDANIYLLSQATRPIVLVECGFLSNTQELQLLKTQDYQARMAFAIAGGFLKGC